MRVFVIKADGHYRDICEYLWIFCRPSSTSCWCWLCFCVLYFKLCICAFVFQPPSSTSSWRWSRASHRSAAGTPPPPSPKCSWSSQHEDGDVESRIWILDFSYEIKIVNNMSIVIQRSPRLAGFQSSQYQVWSWWHGSWCRLVFVLMMVLIRLMLIWNLTLVCKSLLSPLSLIVTWVILFRH